MSWCGGSAMRRSFFSSPVSFLSRRAGREGVSLGELKSRRENLVKLLEPLCESERGGAGGLGIFVGGGRQYMSQGIPYFFRQDSNFRYLSEVLEPYSLLCVKVPEREWTLFLRDSDPRRDLWEGPSLLSLEEAPGLVGVEKALGLSKLNEYLETSLVNNSKRVIFYDPSHHPPNTSLQNEKWWEAAYRVLQGFLSSDIPKVINPRPMIESLRLFKSKGEIDLMRKSAQISSFAISEAMKETSTCKSERDVLATFEYHSRINGGAGFLAYPPVVASGQNANIIHYTRNDSPLNCGDMILIDAGVEYNGYASDISRAWPINGKFSNLQEVVYQIVHNVQTSLLVKLSQRPSHYSLESLYRLMLSELEVEISSAGILCARTASISSTSRELCPHHVGHYLGMDVHDTPTASKAQKLSSGMVITCEPGLYIDKNRFQGIVKKEFLGIGVRIEDDVAINEESLEILTDPCPKTVHEIENRVTQY